MPAELRMVRDVWVWSSAIPRGAQNARDADAAARPSLGPLFMSFPDCLLPTDPGHLPRSRTIALAATCAVALLIAALTLSPSVSPPVTGLPLTDKAYHLLAFASLVVPVAFVLPHRLGTFALAAFLYGAAIEAIQPMVGRAAELADLAANTLGIAIGIGLGLALRAALPARRVARPASEET